MKIFLKVIGIIITIFSSIYLVYCLLIVGMSLSYGVKTSKGILLLPMIILAIGIMIIVSSNDKISDKEYNEYKRYKEEREKIYINHRNYECKRYNEYLLSPQEKLNKIYSELPTSEQQKIVQYAESVYKKHESEKYM